MAVPKIYYPSWQWDDTMGYLDIEALPDNWVPKPFRYLLQRIKASFLVFGGKADAIMWPPEN